MCSDAPDPDPAIGQAAKDNIQLSREMLDYYKQRDLDNKPRQEKMDAIVDALTDDQMETSRFNTQQARDTWDRYKATGIPAEDAMYEEAKNYDNQAARDKAAGEAATDVDVSMAAAADAQRRQMARAGVNPADGMALQMDRDAATTGALAKASAMNGARTRVQDMGVMLRKDAASFARGMPGSAAQTFGVASAAGGQATGAAATGMATANANTGTMGAGYTGAVGANNSGASILNQSHSNQINGMAAESAMTGQLIGAVGKGVAAYMASSDENLKEGIKPVSGRKALEGIKKTPVSEWQYKEGTAPDDGGQRHVGAMAQDLQQNLGEEVAPGGTKVDLISAVGTTMAAVKEVAKTVDKLEKRMARKGVKA